MLATGTLAIAAVLVAMLIAILAIAWLAHRRGQRHTAQHSATTREPLSNRDSAHLDQAAAPAAIAEAGISNTLADTRAKDVHLGTDEHGSRIDVARADCNLDGATAPDTTCGDRDSNGGVVLALTHNPTETGPDSLDQRDDLRQQISVSDGELQTTAGECASDVSPPSYVAGLHPDVVDQDAVESPTAGQSETANAGPAFPNGDQSNNTAVADPPFQATVDTITESGSSFDDDENEKASDGTSTAYPPASSPLEIEQETPDTETGSIQPRETATPKRGSSRERRAPQPYRPAPRVPRRAARTAMSHESDASVRDRALATAIRISFRPGGLCQFSLLAQRREDLPNEIEVRGPTRTELFKALQEDWYELSEPEDLRSLLHGGVWTPERATATITRWVLAPREVYVLGAVPDFAGYVTVPRLVVNESHVVLCTIDCRKSVLDALVAAGCEGFVELHRAEGVPEGWSAFKGVKPTRPVAAANDGGILDTLRPLADVEIVIRGGIQVGRAEWLRGHPPTIWLRGDIGSVEAILVDEQPGIVNDEGKCEAPGQSALGEHIVWTPSTSRTYRIVEGLEDWEPWPAHPFPAGVICGAGVFSQSGSGSRNHSTMVPTRDAVLLGAKPGEVHYCTPDDARHSPVSIVFSRFEPVWLVPHFPLRCDKRAARVVLLRSTSPAPIRIKSAHRSAAPSVLAWSRLVLDARRRGLRISPSGRHSDNLWDSYVQVARTIWRATR